MAVNLSPVGGVAAQFFTNTGAVLTGGKLYTYLAGTTTPTPTYTTSAGNVARTNPIVLDAAGRVSGSGEIWVTSGIIYKFVLRDSNDVLIATYDNVNSDPNTNASQVTYEPPFINAVTTTVRNKLSQTVSIKDFGGVGDGVTDNLLYFKAALQYLESIGGGSLYCPAGTYATTKPIIVRSNIELYGDGAATIIKNINPAGYSPIGDCIHIGITNEWKDWEGNSGGITDANITQWDTGDYSYITTENVHIHDLTVASGAPIDIEGMGIWVVNSQNFVVENIWADRVSTPVSVANDNPTSYGGSRNGVVRAIFQVTAGRWYDLVYTGEAELIDISQCFNNPISNALLNTAIAIGGHSRFIHVHHNVIRFQNFASGLAIDTSGPATPNQDPNYFDNNTIVAALVGVVTYQMNNQVVRDNNFYGCQQGIRVYSTGHTFSGNNFYGCTYDLYYQSGASATHLNMVLSYDRLGEETGGLVNSQLFRSCVGVGGYRENVYHPVDYVIQAQDISKITAQNAILTTTAAAAVGLWFRLPANMSYLITATFYWYANAAGEVVTAGLYRRQANGGYSSFEQISGTQTFTSVGAADIASTWSVGAVVGNIETVLNDQYYIKLTTAFASTASQLRESWIQYRSFGANQ